MGFWSNSFKFGLYDRLMPVNYDRSIEKAFQLLKPQKNASVADFGCGTGRLLVHAKTWLDRGGTLHCFDIDENALKAAEARAFSLQVFRATHFQKADLTQSENLGGPFDGAIAHFSLYTLSEASARLRALEQMARHLKVGACLVLSVPSEHYRIAQIIQAAKHIESERKDISKAVASFRKNVLYAVTGKAMMKIEKALDEGLFHRFTAEELTQTLNSAGFKTQTVLSGYSGCGHHAVAVRI